MRLRIAPRRFFTLERYSVCTLWTRRSSFAPAWKASTSTDDRSANSAQRPDESLKLPKARTAPHFSRDHEGAFAA
jgi:hypothetical protein